jgi:hypothetical protein
MTAAERAAVVERVYREEVVEGGLVDYWDLAQMVPGPNASLEQLWVFCGPGLEDGADAV